jgi:hypothetical protein
MKKYSILMAILAILALTLGIIGCGGEGSGGGGGFAPQTLTVHNYGPYVIDIGTGNGNQHIYLSTGQRVEFNFHASGSLVWFKVLDPNGNIIVTGAGGNKVQDGSGSFTASGSGSYAIEFISSGILTPSVIAISYTVYG